MNNKNLITENIRMVDIYVRQYEDRNLVGTIFHEAIPEMGYRFESTVQLLLLIDKLMDDIHYPERSNVYRTFGVATPVNPVAGKGLEREQLDAIASFHIRMIFRQNTSWQGQIIWSKNGRKDMFRSVMELLILMDSALTDTQVPIPERD